MYVINEQPHLFKPTCPRHCHKGLDHGRPMDKDSKYLTELNGPRIIWESATIKVELIHIIITDVQSKSVNSV
jgi:hypothetical protein